MERPTLLDLLGNSIVLHHICPYCGIKGLLNLAATSKALRSLVFQNPGTFRYLDLSTTKGAKVDLSPIDKGGTVWRNERIDESTTAEDFYSGPVRGIFSYLRRRDVLASVQVLVLDHVSAPAEVLREVICDEPYQVRILSVIGSKNLNEKKFQQVLRYAVRPTRPPGTPKLKGVYVFGTNSRPSLENLVTPVSIGVTDSPAAHLGAMLNRKSHEALQGCLSADVNPWYRNSGKVLARASELHDWAKTLVACKDIIAFDAVLCRGPRHDPDYALSRGADSGFLSPNIASIALRGCELCNTLPEGPASSKEAPSARLPLLQPVQRHSSSIKAAQVPPPRSELDEERGQLLYARCAACCLDRWCEGCGKFWCEDHYDAEKNTYTHMQQLEALEDVGSGSSSSSSNGRRMNLKVHLGLCVERCLVNELISGSDGMWG